MAVASPTDRGIYLYAVGKVLADRNEYAQSFAAYSKGAALLSKLRPFATVADRAVADEAKRGWDAAVIEAIAGQVRCPTAGAIIVTGSPRSGSTLVEHILASHSYVVGGEEFGSFAQVVHRVGGTSGDAVLAWMQRQSPDEAALHYQHLLKQRFRGSGIVVDKTLDASRYLGLLAAVMPEAPIIWMRRDPLDCAWSCYRTYFARGVDWSWSLSTIAQHFRIEDELLGFWRSVLGTRLLVVSYEQLVSDKEQVIPEILQHCGLPMQLQVLTPERTQRTVSTNSVAQVREPISTRAIDSARPYREYLQPFIDAYHAT